MFELVPEVRQRQCIVLETDRKIIPSRRSSMTEQASSVCWQPITCETSGHGGQAGVRQC